MLIILTTISVGVIVVFWGFYLNWTIQSPASDAPPAVSTTDIFKTGISVIRDTIETGFINSYLYFHTLFSSGRTFMIQK